MTSTKRRTFLQGLLTLPILASLGKAAPKAPQKLTVALNCIKLAEQLRKLEMLDDAQSVLTIGLKLANSPLEKKG